MSEILPLHEDLLRSRDGKFERKAWLWTPTGSDPVAALLFLDAELYLERVQALETIARLAHQTVIPPLAAAFISSHNAAARHGDFVCNPDYAQFIASDVVPWLRERIPTAQDLCLAGLSLSGLAAAYIATHNQDIFRTAICQSPSFWWERGRFGLELPPAENAAQELWICVGDQEHETDVAHPPTGLKQQLSQIQGCDRVCADLRRRGYRISYRQYHGGHDPSAWREDLALALAWAYRT